MTPEELKRLQSIAEKYGQKLYLQTILINDKLFQQLDYVARSLAQQGSTIVSITHRSLGWYFRRSARSRAHADWPVHLRSDRRPAADFRYRGIDKLVTEVETLLGTATLPSSLFILMTNRLDPTVLPT